MQNEELKGGVYEIYCIPTNKRYYGRSGNLEFRIRTHQKQLAKGTHTSKEMQSDYKKHGSQSFCYNVLLSTDTFREASMLESKLINEGLASQSIYNTAAVISPNIERPFMQASAKQYYLSEKIVRFIEEQSIKEGRSQSNWLTMVMNRMIQEAKKKNDSNG